MTAFQLSQSLVGTAILFDAASFQFRSRKAILWCFLASSALISAHFFVLGEMIGGVLYSLTFARFLTGYFSQKRHWLILFICLSLIAFCFTYCTPISVLALFGSLASTCAAFQPTDLKLRVYMLTGTLLWLVFNWSIWSPTAVVRQSIFVVSNLLGLWRYYGVKNDGREK